LGFRIASITKPFVATAVMQRAEQGKVDLDARVTRYLPYFRLKWTTWHAGSSIAGRMAEIRGLHGGRASLRIFTERLLS